MRNLQPRDKAKKTAVEGGAKLPMHAKADDYSGTSSPRDSAWLLTWLTPCSWSHFDVRAWLRGLIVTQGYVSRSFLAWRALSARRLALSCGSHAFGVLPLLRPSFVSWPPKAARYGSRRRRLGQRGLPAYVVARAQVFPRPRSPIIAYWRGASLSDIGQISSASWMVRLSVPHRVEERRGGKA
jgi:hypothetical protein